MKFRHSGAEKKLSFGSYPQVTLRDARKMRDEARDLLAEGKDPALEKQRDQLRAGALAENTFTSIANEYCRKRRRDMHERYEKSVYVRFRHWPSSTYGTRCSPRWSILSCR